MATSPLAPAADPEITAKRQALLRTLFCYDRIGYDQRLMTFCKDGSVALGAGGRERQWRLLRTAEGLFLEIASDTEPTCRLVEDASGDWVGRWFPGEQMPVRLSPLPETPAMGSRRFIELFLPDVPGRALFVQALLQVYDERSSGAVLVHAKLQHPLNATSESVSNNEEERCLAWYAAMTNGSFQAVTLSSDNSAPVSDSVDLLILDAEEGDVALPQFSVSRALARNVSAASKVGLEAAGLVQSRTEATYTLFEKPDQSKPDQTGEARNPLLRLTSQRMFTRPYVARVCRHDRGNFAEITGANVLIYWPHGFGDLVFLSYILPLLSPTNRYYIFRFGDSTTSLFEDSPYITPLYLGENTTSSGHGGAYKNTHFGRRYDEIDGSVRTLELPLSLYERCHAEKIDTILWSSHPEVYGRVAFPYHSKGRNLIQHLVPPAQREALDLNRPLRSGLHFAPPPWLLRWVEARLQSWGGFGPRKLCLIARNGYTSTQKNWGHLWREELPEGKQREGEECRDFMRRMLRKDPNWLFLSLEDRHFTGDDTLQSEALHTLTYAQLFGDVANAGIPFGLVLKALMHLASLVVGVPTGPYHLAMARGDLPTVGIWLTHLPSWYDEPSDCSRHLIGRDVLEGDAYGRPGSFFEAGGLRFRARLLDTHIATGEAVLEAVEELL
jgi:hypothetical protein